MAFGYLRPYRRNLPETTSGAGGSVFDLQRQMNRLFSELFEPEGDSGFYARSGIAAPAMDIHQDDDKVEITAELPGVKEEDVDLTIEDGILALRGEKKSTREDKESGYSERSYGSFERRITLPANIDEDNCSADFADGVLTVTLPKTEEKNRGRRIPLGKSKSAGNRDENRLIDQGAKKGEQQKNEKQKGELENA